MALFTHVEEICRIAGNKTFSNLGLVTKDAEPFLFSLKNSVMLFLEFLFSVPETKSKYHFSPLFKSFVGDIQILVLHLCYVITLLL